MTKTGKNNPTNPSKKAEFEAFIELIKGNTVAYWVQIAQVLGVDRTTVAEWKKHPLAKKAIKDGIERAMEQMEKSGQKDWKMWESKLKMLGVAPIEKQDITSDGGKIKPLLGGISSDEGSNSNKQISKVKKEN